MSRPHRSHAQWLELFEAFEQSGQTQAVIPHFNRQLLVELNESFVALGCCVG